MVLSTLQNFFVLIYLTEIISHTQDDKQPNIIFIFADDLGWNDVGFHGSNEIPTPNIDALAYSGVILNNYYVNSLCSPSRSALMTGKYPINTGMQHLVLLPAEPRGLNLSEKLLPQYLKELGYVNHMVGKWHLGYWKKEYTPLHRGFDSHLGYYNWGHHYYSHTLNPSPSWGYDMRRNMSVAFDLNGQYSTSAFTDESVKIINNHDTSKPLFLYLAHAAVHSATAYDPLPAPDNLVASFANLTDDRISNYRRQKFAAMLTLLDASVGEVLQALANKKMLENSIIIFSTDNGGAPEGFDANEASNWPLKGVKNSLWEGGVRGAAAIFSPLIKGKSRVSYHMMHLTDWLPTLVDAAGGNSSQLSQLDGISMWNTLTNNVDSGRSEILLNINQITGEAGLRVGDYKIITGRSNDIIWDGWFGPSGRNGTYDLNLIETSAAYQALKSVKMAVALEEITTIRANATVSCSNLNKTSCQQSDVCLYNIKTDPCEFLNLADTDADILESMVTRLQEYNATSLPPQNVADDPNADPRLHQHVWSIWGDNEIIS
ncbi:arylsulfatase I-like isoform X2 [Cylas formicarius]|uniref:arylsulfatase I-like isoform X2 n=1 Tax=Cylas formicarius TaxID=197179 RepID=UPI0029585647|nr:arylsulfatase I-like isoform X2 [Cylas formicarius]